MQTCVYTRTNQNKCQGRAQSQVVETMDVWFDDKWTHPDASNGWQVQPSHPQTYIRCCYTPNPNASKPPLLLIRSKLTMIWRVSVEKLIGLSTFHQLCTDSFLWVFFCFPVWSPPCTVMLVARKRMNKTTANWNILAVEWWSRKKCRTSSERPKVKAVTCANVICRDKKEEKEKWQPCLMIKTH